MSIEEFKKRQVYTRIVEWDNVAENELDTIKRFIFRWISFNGLYSAIYSMEHGQSESENASENTKLNHFYRNYILTNKIPSVEIYSDKLNEVFLSNIHNKKGKMGNYLKILEKTKDIKEKVRSLIHIAYIIRCRLFHGEKNPILDINEIVCDAADQVIAPILKFIKNT